MNSISPHTTTRLLGLLFLFIPSAVAAQSAPPRKDIPTIAKAASGAIVTIITAANDKPIAQGTGFLVSMDGVIVTNYHVIKEGNKAIVKFSDRTVLPVDGVLAADKVRDLAVIKIHGKTFRTLTLGNSDRVQVGEEVVAIGNPLGLELTVSNGILSGLRTDKEAGGKFLQTTAPISPGSSGGPLFNMRGEVVGINTMYLEGGENLNFAIPVNDAKLLLSNQSAKLQDLPNELDYAALLSKFNEERRTERELQDTMNWINDSFKENRDPVRDGRARLTSVDCLLAALPPGEGHIVWVRTFVSAPDAHISVAAPYEIDEQLKLRDIDPDTLSFQKTPSGRYMVTARTTNDELKIDDRVHKEKTNSITFDLDPDYGPRFIKAFKRAVILDGGKPSMF